MTSQIYCFDFTANCEKVPFDKMKGFLQEYCKKWVFQKEQGEGGYIHYQGRMSVKEKVRIGTMVNLWNKAFAHGAGRVSITSETTAESFKLGKTFYVTKDETRVEGPWSDQDAVEPEKFWDVEKLHGALYPWQKYVADDCKKRDERTINVIIDPDGNRGKSKFAKYLRVTGLAMQIPPFNNFKDLLQAVCTMPTQTAFIVDMPRGLNQETMHGFWSAIESIKNGYVVDLRYKFREKLFNPPQVWVFMNHIPDTPMSKDRWKWWTITDGELVKYEVKHEEEQEKSRKRKHSKSE